MRHAPGGWVLGSSVASLPTAENDGVKGEEMCESRSAKAGIQAFSVSGRHGQAADAADRKAPRAQRAKRNFNTKDTKDTKS